MVPSAPNTPPNPHDQRPTTGSLEDVFRQKFAEAEVTPRASLWDQLDHELLVQQNDTYRRRLALHRWVAAACVLLLLGGGVWATWRQWGLSNGVGTTPNILASANSGQAESSRLTGDGAAVGPGAAVAGRAERGLASAAGTGSYAAGADGIRGEAAAAYASTGRLLARATEAGLAGWNPAGAPGYAGAGLYSQPSGGYPYGGAAAGFGGGSAPDNSAWGSVALRTIRVSGAGLSGRPDTLKPALLAVPLAPAAPTELAAASSPNDNKPAPAKLWRRLRLGGTYAASSFSPNINFSSSDSRAKADPVTMALRNYYQDDAEQEYRRNLRAGLSQRVALAAAYALNDRWTIVSGAEVAEHRATSATTYGFLDGQQPTRLAADLFRPAVAVPTRPEARATSYRYRTASVPVLVRYGSGKPGVSLYAKVGAAVSVLLSSHSELEGSPEAARTYTLSSKESPYRQVLTSARAGAGVRYQPADASWSLALGPTAEIGLTTLNANPSQRLLRQSRPYSVGVEASVEFGTTKAAPVVQQ